MVGSSFFTKWWFVNKKLQYSRWFDHVCGPCPHSNCIVFLQPYCKPMIWNTCWLMAYIQRSLTFWLHCLEILTACFPGSKLVWMLLSWRQSISMDWYGLNSNCQSLLVGFHHSTSQQSESTLLQNAIWYVGLGCNLPKDNCYKMKITFIPIRCNHALKTMIATESISRDHFWG